jgi:hypothetical protein
VLESGLVGGRKGPGGGGHVGVLGVEEHVSEERCDM